MRRYDFDAGYSSQQNASVPNYEYPEQFKAPGTGIDTAHAIAEHDGTTNEYYEIKKPSEDSLNASKCILMAGSTFDADKFGTCAVMPRAPLWVAYDSAAGTPVVGGEVGTVTDSWKLAVDQTGWYVVDVNTTEGLCLVRPFSTGDIESYAFFSSKSTSGTTAVSAGDTYFYTDWTNFAEKGSVSLTATLSKAAGDIILCDGLGASVRAIDSGGDPYITGIEGALQWSVGGSVVQTVKTTGSYDNNAEVQRDSTSSASRVTAGTAFTDVDLIRLRIKVTTSNATTISYNGTLNAGEFYIIPDAKQYS